MLGYYQNIDRATKWFNSQRARNQRKVVAADKQRVRHAKRMAMAIVNGTAPHEYDARGNRLMTVDGFMNLVNKRR